MLYFHNIIPKHSDSMGGFRGGHDHDLLAGERDAKLAVSNHNRRQDDLCADLCILGNIALAADTKHTAALGHVDRRLFASLKTEFSAHGGLIAFLFR